FFDADHPATGVPFPRRSTDKGYCIQRVTQTAESLLGVRNSATGATAIRCIVGAPRRYGLQVRMSFR
uniref:hypothetical protein n=1 Tax=Sphingomonas sp. TaxID=28214 RepID=UPI0035C8123C